MRIRNLIISALACLEISSGIPLAADVTDSHDALFRSSASVRNFSVSDRFQRGQVTLQFINGVLASPVGIGPDSDTFNHTMHNLRLGWVLNTPQGDAHPLNGAVEVLAELSGSAIFDGAGSYLVGPSIHIRYNFIQPGWKLVPYIQIGGGLTFTDADEDQSQRAIGQELEFTPQASIGCRYFIDPQWSLDAEFIYHHISNAGLSDRNLGINALGGMVGFSYFFDSP